MKVIAFLGSPRKEGITSLVTERILDKVKELGAETKEYFLNEMKFKGCQGCQACKKGKDFCVIEDDLSEALRDMKDADAFIFASPVYFGDVTGQFKCFWDRTYCFFNPNFTLRFDRGKKCAVVLAQGDPNLENFKDLFPRYQKWFKFCGFEGQYLIRIAGISAAKAVLKKDDIMKQADDIAEKLVKM